MRRIKKNYLILMGVMLCLIWLTILPVSAKAEEQTKQVDISVVYGQSEAREMLEMVNKFRTSDTWYWNADNATKTSVSGMSPLVYDYQLEQVAMKRAAEIAVLYDHQRPDGSMCFTAYTDEFAFGYMAENIAAGYTSAADVFDGWKEENEEYNYQGHRRNMLSSNAVSIGIGHVTFNGYHYWVQEFSSVDSGAVQTPAQDTAQNESIVIQDSFIEKAVISSQKDVTLECGTSMALPGSYVELTVSEHYPFGESIIVNNEVTNTILDTEIAELSGTAIQAKKIGSTTLRLSAFGITKDVPLTVDPKTVKVSQIKLTGISNNIAAGKKITLKASIMPADATEQSLKWTTSNSKMATVSNKGVVSVKKSTGGKKVTITATAKDGSGIKAVYKINVKKGVVKSVAVTGSKTIKAGKSQKLKSKVTASAGANKKLAWSSSNTQYATVNASGKVTAPKAGKGKSVTITAAATDGSGKKAKIVLKIK